MSDRPRLLREWYKVDYTPTLIKEDREKNGGKIILKGIIQKADAQNQNKRIYPQNVLRREVENYQKAVRESRAVGELDHPESSTVSLANVSHVLREVWWEGNTVMGKVEVLSTPRGKILESLLESGISIGISSRGVGTTQKTNEGLDEVQPDYQILCWDIVSEPSTPGAYLFTEAREISLDGPVRMARADRIYRSLNAIVGK
jgi:Prohead core protein serine protease